MRASAEKDRFVVLRQGRHAVTGDGSCLLAIPRYDPVDNAVAMAGIVHAVGLSIEQFRELP